MPIYKHQQVNSIAKLWVWHITEDEQGLTKNVSLTPHCNLRLQAMSHSSQRKGFLAVRLLLIAAGLSLDGLRYTSEGKPYLQHGPHISFSHSKDFAAVAIGQAPIGVDVERHRTKVKRVAKKFVNPADQAPQQTIAELTDLWCAKESMYKAISIPGIRFSKDISVNLTISNKGVAIYKDETYDLFSYAWQGHSCAVTIKKLTMNISVELTFTPLHDQYKDRIKKFILDLRSGGFTISESPLSTQLYGTYDKLMPFLMKTIKTALSEKEKGIMHLKIYNADRSNYVSDF